MKLYKITANVGTQYVVKLKEVEVRRYGSKFKEIDGPTLVPLDWIDAIRPRPPLNVDGHIGVVVWFEDPTMVDYWKWKVHNAMLDQLAKFKAELFAKILMVSNGPTLTVEGNDEKTRENTLDPMDI